MSPQGSLERRVGIFVLLAVLAGGGFLATRLVQEHVLDRPWKIRLEMDHGYGLAPGSAVKMSGIPVGTVLSIDLMRDGKVSTLIGVRRRHRKLITDTARFAVRQPLVLGDAWVEIVQEGPAGEPLAEGAVRPVEVPQAALADLGITKERITSLFDTVQTLLSDASGMLSDIRAGKGNVGRFMSDTALYEGFSKAVDQTNAVLERTRSSDNSVGKLFTESKLHDELTGLTAEIRDTLKSLRGEEDQAKEAVRRLNTLLASADKAVVEIERIATSVNEGKGTVGKFVKDDAVYVEAKRVLAQLRETLEDLREQTPISTFMGALFSAF